MFKYLLNIFKSTPKNNLTPQTQDLAELQAELLAKAGANRLDFEKIWINPNAFPVIDLPSKPDNKEYLSIKMSLREQALNCLAPYIEFVQQLEGINNNIELKNMVMTITRNFIMRYWDMPSSRNNHHAYAWGHCLHSLEVACAEAKQMQAWIPMSKYGIDEVALARFKGFVVLGHFVKGLMHDAHKLYQCKLSGENEHGRIYYSAHKASGNILDFKITYPKNLNYEWEENEYDAGKLNLIEFFFQTPREFAACVPYIELMIIIDAISIPKSFESDKLSAIRDISRIKGSNPLEIIKQNIKRYFKQNSGKVRPNQTIFRLNHLWTAVDAQKFFNILTSHDGFTDIVSLQEFLIYNKLLKSNSVFENTPFIVNLPFQVYLDDKTSQDNRQLAFLSTTLFDDINTESKFNMLGKIYFLEENKTDLAVILNELDDCFIKKFYSKKQTEEIKPEPKILEPNIISKLEPPTKPDFDFAKRFWDIMLNLDLNSVHSDWLFINQRDCMLHINTFIKKLAGFDDIELEIEIKKSLISANIIYDYITADTHTIINSQTGEESLINCKCFMLKDGVQAKIPYITNLRNQLKQG